MIQLINTQLISLWLDGYLQKNAYHHINACFIEQLQNKTAMRIMELYRIQNDYKSHKRRLQSIQQLNSKQRVIKATTNEHKKLKINAEIFHEREQLSRREKTNQLMHKTISDHSKRIRQQYESSLLAGIHPDRPQRRGGESDRIELENAKLREKIDKMKSVYKQARKNSDLSLPSHLQQREKSRQTEKDKLVKMLKTQFKMEPIVTFPRSKAKTNSNDLQPEVSTSKKEKSMVGNEKQQVELADSSLGIQVQQS